jgi:hypothetical protein
MASLVGVLLFAGVAAAVYLGAMVIAVMTPKINPGQKTDTAWNLTLDLSPWTLDVPWRYRPARVHEVLVGWGPAGRQLALWLHLTLDVVFPLAYAVALSMAITLGLKSAAVWILPIVLPAMPVVAAGADWTENALIAWLSWRNPSQTEPLGTVLWFISSTKWVLLLLSLGVAVGLLVLRALGV